MTARSAFQTQILEKLAAPLMAAIADVAARKRDGEDILVQEDAEYLAVLLNKSVHMAIALANSMDLTASTESADAGRLALAGVVTPVVASFYRQTGRVPSDSDIKRMTKAMDAALTFADSFAPVGENTARLENIRAGDILVDDDQISIRYVHIMGPVVNAVASFSFGRQDTKLVQDVGDKLVARAMDIVGAEKENKLFALGVLESLVDIYVECHRAEKIRLMTMDDMERARMAEENGGAMPMDGVWKAFDMRAAMIEILAGKRTQENQATIAAAIRKEEVVVQPASVYEQTPEPAAPATAPAPVDHAPYAAPDTGASPMSMFASGDNPAKEAPSDIVAQPVESNYEPPVAIGDDYDQNDHYDDRDDEDDEGSGDEGGYNPMSFFSGSSSERL